MVKIWEAFRLYSIETRAIQEFIFPQDLPSTAILSTRNGRPPASHLELSFSDMLIIEQGSCALDVLALAAR